MKKALFFIGTVLLYLLLSGNFTAFFQVFSVLKDIFVGFYPIFFEVGKKAVEDYLTSPYFITGVIMAIASAFGIYFSSKGGKVLWIIVSIVCELASVASILNNLL